MTLEKQQDNRAESNAKNWGEIISTASEAAEFCCEEGEGKELSKSAKSMLHELGYDGTNHAEIYEAIEQQMRESILSVSVQSDWQAPNEELSPSRYQILLSWGGPSLRITGSIDEWYSAITARVEIQDWGTPWSDIWVAAEEDLLWFANLFFFGN